MVVNSPVGEELDVVWLFLRVQIILKQQVTVGVGARISLWCEGCRGVKPLRVSTDHLEPCHGFLIFLRICMASFLNVAFS